MSILKTLNQALHLSLSTRVQFIKGMNQERSTALYLIRGIAATMFDHDELPSECFTQCSFSRSNIDRIRFLLGTAVDSNGETTNSEFPPIVFEDNNPAMARGLFRNDILFKVLVFHFLPHEIQVNKIYLIDCTRGYLWKASSCLEALRWSAEHPLSEEQ